MNRTDLDETIIIKVISELERSYILIHCERTGLDCFELQNGQDGADLYSAYSSQRTSAFLLTIRFVEPSKNLIYRP